MTLEEVRELQQRQLAASAAGGSEAAAAAKPPSPRTTPATLLTFEPWQERRLAMAHTEGRRRVAVGQLADSLGVDRRAVLDWFRAFPSRPRAERLALVEAAAEERRGMTPEERAKAVPMMPKATKNNKGREEGGGGAPEGRTRREREGWEDDDRDDAADADDAWANASGSVGRGGGAAASSQPPALPAPHVGVAAAAALRRLPAEVNRTLEAVYARTPYPGAEVMQSLYSLHRLPRPVAAAWFSLRRAADGRPQNPRKAAGAGAMAMGMGMAAQTAVRKADASGFVEDASVGRDVEDAWWLVGGVDGGGEGGGGGGGGDGSADAATANAAAVLSTAAAEAAAISAALASPQLRSSLPSPRKVKKAPTARPNREEGGETR
jgi:hypothetical protein